MKFLVKGSPMSRGARATAQEIGPSGRYAVGLFGGSALADVLASGISLMQADRVPFPPHTVILLADDPA
ncbi:MAG: hypothetical protein V2A79_06810 [Planctomycetota bacterium]